MREILFRAYDKTMKRYKPFDGEHDTMLISRDGKIDYYNLQNGSGFDEYILEQFTGLTDKNGNKIFEGDIVFAGYGEYYQGTHEHSTTITVDMSNYDALNALCNANVVEVIGNIHDNPELLP